MNFPIPKATAIGFAGMLSIALLPPGIGWAQEDEVLATVNGDAITRADLQAAYVDLPQQVRQMPLETIEGPLLDQLIDQALLIDEAKERGLESEADVEAAMERAADSILLRALVERTVSETVTEEALQEAYEDEVANAEPAEEVHARHILLESEEDAKAVIAELQGGADFETLARERSTGPSGPNGGDLGYFREGSMVPEFAEAAFSMEPGTYTEEPVQTQFGWHVIRVEDKRTVEPSFEEMEPQLREALEREVFANLLEDLRGEAEIERMIPPTEGTAQ